MATKDLVSTQNLMGAVCTVSICLVRLTHAFGVLRRRGYMLHNTRTNTGVAPCSPDAPHSNISMCFWPNEPDCEKHLNFIRMPNREHRYSTELLHVSLVFHRW